MKNIHKLSAIAIMLIGIAMATDTIAQQTTNQIPKWSGSAYINTVTPIFEDATNSRIGIGTTSPQQKLSISNAVNLDQSSSNTGTIGNAFLWRQVFFSPDA